MQLKQSLIKAATPFLYMKKKRNDDKFFREIELKRRGVLIQERINHN